MYLVSSCSMLIYCSSVGIVVPCLMLEVCKSVLMDMTGIGRIIRFKTTRIL